ncbi:hypothetical protein [Bacillus cereus]|uniref:hypothetical protein n=2 Tax=Bacillus cereus group TaxID=86661 RepID=UPI001C552264|nr:hypothetical protein [Bacillus cereus]
MYLDILVRMIVPETFKIPIIEDSLDVLLKGFERLLKGKNIPLDNVSSATASIAFNVESPSILIKLFSKRVGFFSL